MSCNDVGIFCEWKMSVWIFLPVMTCFVLFFCALLFLPSGVYVKDVMCNVFFVTARKKMIVYIPLCVRDNNNLSQGDPSAWNIDAAAARLLAAAAGYKDTSNASYQRRQPRPLAAKRCCPPHKPRLCLDLAVFCIAVWLCARNVPLCIYEYTSFLSVLNDIFSWM